MRVLVAPQEFKGTLTASEAARALAEGVREALPAAEVDVVPVSDGGPGLAQLLVDAAGGELRRARVKDPLGRDIEACWGLLPGGSAVIDMAAAAGLVLLGEKERDPRVASTYGVGQLVEASLDAGAIRVIIGVGGSATNDGGAGMAAALGVRFLDAQGRDLRPGGAALAELDRIDLSGLDPRVRRTTFVAAVDVTNPLCGPRGASLVYGPQKGATTETALALDEALGRYGRIVERDTGVKVLDVEGAGAAGGLAAGLIAFTGARLLPGFEVVAEAVKLRERVRSADLVMTGEGRLDGQTAYGKTVARVSELAREAGAPVIVIAGSLGDGWEALAPLFAMVEVAGSGPAPADAVRRAAAAALRLWAGRR